MKRLVLFVLALALPVSYAQDRRITPAGSAPRRLALVIGNDKYTNQPPLRNSVNDAVSMGQALRELGFGVDVRLNVSMIQTEEAAEKFAASVRPGDIALFYYSGHGMQVGDQNYLIPVDFDARTPADAKYKAYAANRIQDNLEASGASLQILILDACRDNPYRSVRSASGGLASMQAGKGVYIAFATAPGRTADDNGGGSNGLFTAALLDALRRPGLTLDQVFNQVRVRVSDARPDQVPWSTSSVIGEFYFRNTAPAAAPNVSVPSAAKGKVIFSAGSMSLSAAEFEELIGVLPEQYRAAARGASRRQFAEQLATLEILAAEARRLGLDQDPEARKKIAFATDQFQIDNSLAQFMYEKLKLAVPRDQDVRAYYESHKADFEQVRARHILIRVKDAPMPLPEGKKDLNDDEALKEATRIYDLLIGGADFATVAKSSSYDTGSAPAGGDLGFFRKGIMVPDFERAAFSLGLGQISHPVRTPFGYHIIKAEENKIAAFEEERTGIENILKASTGQERLAEIRKRAAVYLDDSYFGSAPGK